MQFDFKTTLELVFSWELDGEYTKHHINFERVEIEIDKWVQSFNLNLMGMS